MANFNILVVDDDPALTGLYEHYLGNEMGNRVEVICSPGEAKHMVFSRMYDVVICDAKMPYKGSSLGGLILAEEISIRLGIGSVLLISQIIDADQIKAIATDIPFLKKDDEMKIEKWFGETLNRKLINIIKRQFGFVAMPFGDRNLDSLYLKQIVPSAKKAGFKICRVDEASFTKSITRQLQKMIKEAHFVIFITQGNNPNVFLEAGYALGLGKEIVMCTSNFNDLPFDIREHNCLKYESKVDIFQQKLEKLLKGLRGLID